MSECSRTKKIACLRLSSDQQGRYVEKPVKIKMGNASNGNCYPAPEVVESFIDVFSETGNRSADLINKDSACAKTKKIAFVGKEK